MYPKGRRDAYLNMCPLDHPDPCNNINTYVAAIILIPRRSGLRGVLESVGASACGVAARKLRFDSVSSNDIR